jgi:restriction system protein
MLKLCVLIAKVRQASRGFHVDVRASLWIRAYCCGVVVSIWSYDESSADIASVKVGVSSTSCRFCAETLKTLESSSVELGPDSSVEMVARSTHREVRACPVCGWWTVRVEHTQHGISRATFGTMGAMGVMRHFNIEDKHAPIDEVRAYLAATYDARFHVDPRVFEDVVTSVFADHGYRARVTAYSGDDGIDVVLDGYGGNVIGIQVKRYAPTNTIQVDQIRELAGALVLNGMTRGIFVTTSSFQSGAATTAQRFANRGYPIELIDAPRFLDALKIAQRNAYQFKDEPQTPYADVRLVTLESSMGAI